MTPSRPRAPGAPSLSGAGPAMGLPLSSPLATGARAHGAVGAALAYELNRAWVRRPGEKRIPLQAKRAALAGLPHGDWPDGEPLSDGQVLDYCNQAGRRRRSKNARQLMAGQSGAQVFELEDEEGEGSIFKMFCSSEEMLLDVAGLEVINALQGHPLKSVAVEHAGTAHGGNHGFVVMEKAKGTVLYSRMDELAAAKGPERAGVLKKLVDELGCAGVALAKFHEAGRSGVPVPDSYKRSSVARVVGLFATAARETRSGPLADAALRSRMLKKLKEMIRDYRAAPLQGTVCIGDIHPGNVAVHQGACTVFDVNTLVGSLGSRGEGIAPSADDRMWFAETIPWYGRKIGLQQVEIDAAYQAFLQAYRKTSPLAAQAEDVAAARFFKLRSALTDLRFAPDSEADVARAVAALELAR